MKGILRTISTHAPRTGSDVWVTAYARRELEISTHAPRTGSDHTTFCNAHCQAFQPTLPARGATFPGSVAHIPYNISTHAPRTGSDVEADAAVFILPRISTHAPRTGSDQTPGASENAEKNFNPRSPHGERRPSFPFIFSSLSFQPTLPARGATVTRPTKCTRCEISTHAPRTGSDERIVKNENLQAISTHAPRTGSDLSFCDFSPAQVHFNPRSPHGERRTTMMLWLPRGEFQPTLPARGATVSGALRGVLQAFQPTLPARGAT